MENTQHTPEINTQDQSQTSLFSSLINVATNSPMHLYNAAKTIAAATTGISKLVTDIPNIGLFGNLNKCALQTATIEIPYNKIIFKTNPTHSTLVSSIHFAKCLIVEGVAALTTTSNRYTNDEASIINNIVPIAAGGIKYATRDKLISEKPISILTSASQGIINGILHHSFNGSYIPVVEMADLWTKVSSGDFISALPRYLEGALFVDVAMNHIYQPMFNNNNSSASLLERVIASTDGKKEFIGTLISGIMNSSSNASESKEINIIEPLKDDLTKIEL